MKLTEVYLNPENPRTITEAQLDKLAKSIEDFPEMMELRPIITDDNGVILGGNQRFKALKKLGYDEVPDNWIVKASNLTAEQMRRFIVQDNVQGGEWDIEALRLNWSDEELSDWGLDIVFEEEEGGGGGGPV